MDTGIRQHDKLTRKDGLIKSFLNSKKMIKNVNRLTVAPSGTAEDTSVSSKYRKPSGGVLVKAMKSKRYRKPDLMVILACSVALGVVLSSMAQAAEPGDKQAHGPVAKLQQFGVEIISGDWLHAIGGLDLATRLKNWKPKIEVDNGGEGLRVSHPFGDHGPALKFSTSIPKQVKRSLRAGGDSQIGSLNDNPDAYLFLQRRW